MDFDSSLPFIINFLCFFYFFQVHILQLVNFLFLLQHSISVCALYHLSVCSCGIGVTYSLFWRKESPFSLFQVHGAPRQIFQDHNSEEAEGSHPSSHGTPKPGTGRRRCVQPANMVPSLPFGKVDATPGRLSICAFLHGRAAISQPWTSREVLSSDSSLTLAIRSHPWAVPSQPLHTSNGPSSSPAPVLSTVLCSTPPVVTGFLLLLTPPCCLGGDGGTPFPCLTNASRGSLKAPRGCHVTWPPEGPIDPGHVP